MASDLEVAIDAINNYGIPAQLRKAAEELIELALECMHTADGNGGKPQKIAEELADVQFVILQIQVIMDNVMNGKFTAITKAAYNYKVERTQQLVMLDKERKGLTNVTNVDSTNGNVESDTQ